MLRDIQQVLRLLLLLGKQRPQRGAATAGGLLVLLWTEASAGASAPILNCTVAAAGSWFRGMKREALTPVLTYLQESMSPCVGVCPEPDPEELCAFTDVHGSLRFLISFQVKDARFLAPEWRAHIKAFLHTFSLANAGIRVHLTLKSNQETLQQDFSVRIKRRVALADQPSLILDVTCGKRPKVCVKGGSWCHGGHPVLGGRVPLSIPPDAMDRGLYGDLSVQLVMLLTPCVLQYPNLETRLTSIQVLAYSPSNVPVTGPSNFFQNILPHLACQELGLQGLRCCSSSTEPSHSGGVVFTAEEHDREEQEESSSLPVRQNLLIFLFLQHFDPFASQLCDMMDIEALIEHHLEDILDNNRRTVTTALHAELKNTLKAQNHRKQIRERLSSAAEVILSSSVSIVSCSSNMDFRRACLSRMKVCDTHELSTSLRESLRRVTLWRCIPRVRCYSAEADDHPVTDEPTRTEI